MTQGPPQGTFYALGKTHLAIKTTIQGKEQATLPCQQVPSKNMHLPSDHQTRSKHNTPPTRDGIMGKNHPKIPRMLSCHTWSFWNPRKLTLRIKRMTIYKQNLRTPKDYLPPSVGAQYLSKVQKLNYHWNQGYTTQPDKISPFHKVAKTFVSGHNHVISAYQLIRW